MHEKVSLVPSLSLLIYMCSCKKKQLETRQRQLGKTVVVKVKAYIVSMDRKTTVYRLEGSKIALFENAYKLSIAMRSCISRAYL